MKLAEVEVSKRAALLIPFFGKVPVYFRLWAESCRHVPEIDFWILTDIARWPAAPANVKFHQVSLSQFESLAAERLGLSLRLSDPYKLCDFKPTLGFLFEQLVEPYDYWGYGDIDQVFSPSLRTALQEMVEGDYDVFNTHAAIMHAPFVLLKNTPPLRELFRCSRDWQAALTDPEYQKFDEAGAKLAPLRQMWAAAGWYDGNWSFLDLPEGQLQEIEPFDCFTAVVHRQATTNGLKVLCQNRCREDLGSAERVWVDADGIRDGSGRDFDFYHWVAEKPRRAFTYPDWSRTPPCYYVTRQGFYDASTPRLNLFRAAFRWCRALYLVVRDRLTFGLHQHFGLTLDKRWRGQSGFR